MDTLQRNGSNKLEIVARSLETHKGRKVYSLAVVPYVSRFMVRVLSQL